MLLLFPAERRRARCAGCSASRPAPRTAISALGEIGNILGASYINALGAMTGLELEPTPPQTATDMLGAIVATVLASRAADDRRRALMLDSDLRVEGEECSLSFLLLPEPGGVDEMLARLGVEA